ncbi:hypothetical protein [Asticcacaulis sp. 201]|uniref:hypothetical protein n=1 Tax=Asticcacaulis sp. 201 TaxID=3028787 RepID=UPI0029168FE2|nr:hypothetical protein [Asticcacaulis sp. 201]MDV6329896.1 hypothetical protein [Asticcacaulis sp. 201]
MEAEFGCSLVQVYSDSHVLVWLADDRRAVRLVLTSRNMEAPQNMEWYQTVARGALMDAVTFVLKRTDRLIEEKAGRTGAGVSYRLVAENVSITDRNLKAIAYDPIGLEQVRHKVNNTFERAVGWT